MNLQEQTNRIKLMMGIDNTRHTFDIQKLVDNNIIFVTKPGDGQGGIDEPNWDGDCSIITLDNLTKQEVKLNPWRLKAIKHPLPNCIPFVQDRQSEWSDEKYHQVINSIKRAGGDIKDYIMNLKEQTNRIHQIMGINESMFFRRRSDVEKIKELLPVFVNIVFYDYTNFDEFKYQLTLRALEYYLKETHDLYWDELPEQEEIEFVNYLCVIFNDTIKELYKSKIKEKY